MSNVRSIGPAETAKLIRSTLKDTFPGSVFSVTTKTYSGGSSIRVRWTDGPATTDVERTVGSFHGASFDGMIDLKSHHDTEYNGEMVHFCADYVFCTRSYSQEFAQTVVDEVADRRGAPWITVTERGNWDTNDSDLNHAIYHAITSRDARLMVA